MDDLQLLSWTHRSDCAAAMSRPEVINTSDNLLELVRLETVDRATAEAANSRRESQLRALLRRHALFLATIALPVIVAVLYYGIIVADRFESEASFVVRSPGRGSIGSLNSFLQSTGIGRASDEADLVHEFIQSRDALRLLVADHSLREMLSRPEADMIWRFPGLFRRDREESLYRYFKRFVTLRFDSSSGISTLAVQAFRPDDAADIAVALLNASERLINRLNDRARADMIRTAVQEVERSQQRAAEARERVTAFRTRAEMIDPTKTSTTVLDTIGKLSLEAAGAKTTLVELQRNSPQSPQIGALRTRVAALENQIFQERRRLGGADGALAPQIAEFEKLNLEREFADRALNSAMTSLENARLDAQRQQLYLERIVEPRPTDYPAHPRRLLSIFLVLLVGCAAFTILRAIGRNIREHRPQ